MNRRIKFTALATAVALLMLAVATVSADAPRPACDRSAPKNVCQANITVFVYMDRGASGGSDTFFDSGTDAPVAGARITFATPDGRWLQQTTGNTGFLMLPSVDFLPEDEAIVEAELPAQYRGMALVPCTSSPVRRQITPETFGELGATRIHFCASPYVPDTAD